MDALKTIATIALSIGVLDIGWLTLRKTYHETLFKSIQHSPIEPRWIPAGLIYILIPVAVYLGAVIHGKTLQDTVFRGAIVGFLLYAFYDLTNYATFTGWTLEMTIVDILWGMTVCSVGAAAGYYINGL